MDKMDTQYKYVVWSCDPYVVGENENEDNEYGVVTSSELEDERRKLDVNVGDEIVAIADLGLWNGRRQGYRIFQSGCIADCLVSNCDYVTWYVDDAGEFRCDASHHDGTNHIWYRTWRKSASYQQRGLLLDRLYCGYATEDDIRKATKRIGPEVCKVYGWKAGHRKRAHLPEKEDNR